MECSALECPHVGRLPVAVAHVLVATAIESAEDSLDRWTVGLVLCAEGVSSQVLDTLGCCLALRGVSPQGPFYQAVFSV